MSQHGARAARRISCGGDTTVGGGRPAAQDLWINFRLPYIDEKTRTWETNISMIRRRYMRCVGGHG